MNQLLLDAHKGETFRKTLIAAGIPVSALSGPTGLLIGGGMSGGVNVLGQYYLTGKVDWSDAAITTMVGATTYRAGPLETVVVNGMGGALSAANRGENSGVGALIWGLSSYLGYQTSSVLTKRLDPAFNSIVSKYMMIDHPIGLTVTQAYPRSAIPPLIGNTTGSVAGEAASEYFGNLKKNGNDKSRNP